jgi:hypothetical protein
MVDSERLIPYKRMRRILKNNVNGDVSKDTVEYLQTVLENQLENICRNVVVEHEEENRLRVFHGLPERKRIDVTLYKKVVEIPYKSTTDLIGVGEVANSVNTTFSDKQNIEVQ